MKDSHKMYEENKKTNGMYEDYKNGGQLTTLGVLLEQVRILMKDMSELKIDVRDLRDFKWKMVGITTLGAFFATIATTIAVELLKK